MKKWNHSICLWTFLIMLLTGCTGTPKTTENTVPNSINSTQNEARLNEQESSISKDTTPNNLLNAYFIDVGQGDACLLEQMDILC